MKLDDLKDLDDLEKKIGADDGIYFEESKKKKKKKKDEDKEDLYKESLKELSKKDLRKKAAELGVGDDVDLDSKKAMRKAILKKVKSSKAEKALAKETSAQFASDSDVGAKTEAPKHEIANPYWSYDAKGDQMVIHKTLEMDDMDLYDAMKFIGKKRMVAHGGDDGFGEMMKRIDDQLRKAEGVFADTREVKALPSTTREEKLEEMGEDELKGEPTLVVEADSIELTEEDTAQLSADVDRALEDLHKAVDRTEQASSKKGSKRKK
jgi:hypothetical protein